MGWRPFKTAVMGKVAKKKKRRKAFRVVWCPNCERVYENYNGKDHYYPHFRNIEYAEKKCNFCERDK